MAYISQTNSNLTEEYFDDLGFVDKNNSFRGTIPTLQSFTGEFIKVDNKSSLTYVLISDQNGDLDIEHSTDGVNVHITEPFNNIAGTPLYDVGNLYSKYVRVKYTNPTVSTANVILQVSIHHSKPPSINVSSSGSATAAHQLTQIANQDVMIANQNTIIAELSLNYSPYMDHAIGEILETYGDTVTITRSSLLKFARSDNIDTTFGMVWMTPTAFETLPTGNTIDYIVSTDAGDTQQVYVVGNTISGSDIAQSIQLVTLAGLTPVLLGTALYRVHKIWNNGSADFIGNISVYDNTSGLTHITADGNRNQSEKSSATTINDQYAIVTDLYGSVLTKTTANVEVSFQLREFGKVFRTVYQFGISNAGPYTLNITPYYIIPPKSDLRIIAKSTANNTEITAGANVLFASV